MFVRNRSHIAVLAVLACTVWLPASVEAQQKRTRVWLSAGLGGGGSTETSGGGGMLQLAVQRAPHQVALRVLGLVDPYGSDDAIGELGILYGRTIVGGYGHATAAAGIAITSVPSNATGESELKAGMPLAVERAVRFLPVLGIGAQVFANLNPSASFMGAVVFIQLGWLP